VGEAALIVGTLVCLVLGSICGLVTLVMLSETSVSKLTAFGWGAVLGPVGIVLAIAMISRSSGGTRLLGQGRRP
jgi:hypothetical protein